MFRAGVPVFRLSVLLYYLITATFADQDTFLDKYAFAKVMQQCLGAANYYRQLTEVTRAKSICLGYRPYTFLITSGPNFFISDRRTERIVSSFLPSHPGPPADNDPSDNRSPGTPPAGLTHNRRRGHPSTYQILQGIEPAGGPLWDADTIARAANHLNVELSNFTCVMESINAIDTELNIKEDSFVNHYYWTTSNDQLRTDLIRNVEFCKEASDGLPLERDHSPLHSRLHRLMFFLKCEKKQRLASCLKHDIRTSLNELNLPGLTSRTDDANQVLALLIGVDGIRNLDLYN